MPRQMLAKIQKAFEIGDQCKQGVPNDLSGGRHSGLSIIQHGVPLWPGVTH